MMYNFFKSIKNTGGLLISPKKELFILKKKDGFLFMILLDGDCNEKEYLKYEKVFRLNFSKTLFLISFKDDKTLLFNSDNKIEFAINKSLSFSQLQENKNFLFINSKGRIFRYDKKNQKINEFEIDRKLLLQVRINNKIIFTNNLSALLFTYNLNLNLLSKKDLSQEASYIHWNGKKIKGEIKKVYSWGNKILVLTTCFLISLNDNGEIIYKLRFPDLLRAQTLVINENKGYIYNYHDYLVVDLEKGKLILHKEIRSFDYQGEKYNNFAQDLIYHQGLLYHSVNSSGLSFVVAINPSTGDTIWRQHVTGQSINSIRFYEDKMYILDGGGTLHIFEKELLT